MVLVISFAVIPVAGVADQAVVGMLSLSLSIGILTGAVVSGASNALFPDPPAPAANRPVSAFVSHEAARWTALRATMIVMPVFVLALTNPSFYVAAIMKTVALSQQAGGRGPFAGRTDWINAMGALVAAIVWFGCRSTPTSGFGLVDDGRRTMDRQRHLSYAIDLVPAFLLEQRADHDVDPARPGDRGQRKRQERLGSFRSPHRALRYCRALCMGNGLEPRTLA